MGTSLSASAGQIWIRLRRCGEQPRPPGRVDQQVVEQLVAADQQVGHPGTRQPGLRHAIAPAVINGLLDFGQLPTDVAHHRLGALAGSGVGGLLHGFHSVG